MKTKIFTALLFLVTSISAQAQWQDGNLALKTNGSVFKSGEQLKVEIVALEAIPEPFYAQVSYSYQVKVKKTVETEKDGKTTTEERSGRNSCEKAKGKSTLAEDGSISNSIIGQHILFWRHRPGRMSYCEC